MDRNARSAVDCRYDQHVALRKESVDRNSSSRQALAYSAVALRKESVDRNSVAAGKSNIRRVALRKESVDRNSGKSVGAHAPALSLSARRAWIEISAAMFSLAAVSSVALRKESVDRNQALVCPGAAGLGRSPQGERG